jgi:predicted DNA-binding transcriptional regulator AlpA
LEAFVFRRPEPTRMSDEILTVQEVAALLKVADKTVYTMVQKDTVAPNGFKGMVVTFDQECCLLYKAALDKILPPEATEVVISATGSDERFSENDQDNSHQLPGDGTLSDVNVVLFTGNDQGRRGFIPQPAGVA